MQKAIRLIDKCTINLKVNACHIPCYIAQNQIPLYSKLISTRSKSRKYIKYARCPLDLSSHHHYPNHPTLYQIKILSFSPFVLFIILFFFHFIYFFSSALILFFSFLITHHFLLFFNCIIIYIILGDNKLLEKRT